MTNAIPLPADPAQPENTSQGIPSDSPLSSIDNDPEFRQVVARLQAEMGSLGGSHHEKWNNNVNAMIASGATVSDLTKTLNSMVKADYNIEEGGEHHHPHQIKPDLINDKTIAAYNAVHGEDLTLSV